MDFERKERRFSDLRVVPLIDVVFFLIFYFLVAGSVQQLAIIPIDPPMAESGKVVEEGPAVFTFGRYDEILFNDEPVEGQAIAPIVKRAVKENPERIITVKMDATLPASRLIDAIDQLKEGGAKNLSLVTQAP